MPSLYDNSYPFPPVPNFRQSVDNDPDEDAVYMSMNSSAESEMTRRAPRKGTSLVAKLIIGLIITLVLAIFMTKSKQPPIDRISLVTDAVEE